MAKKIHSIIYTFPGGQLTAEADSLQKLQEVVSDKIGALLGSPCDSFSLDGLSLEDASWAAYHRYKNIRAARSKRPNRTSLEDRGVEIDAIRCYLSGMKIKETVRFLRKERNVYISKSPVGRFFRCLFLSKIYPIKNDLKA